MTANTIKTDARDVPDRSGSLQKLLALVEHNLRMSFHTAEPCVVIKTTPETDSVPMLVDVQPSTMVVYLRPDGTEEPARPLPIVYACPVGIWNLGGFAIRVQPRPGDFGWLLSSERSLDAWYSGGGAPADPQNNRTHDRTDALFLPMGRPGPAPLKTSANLTIGTDTGAMPGEELGEVVIDPAGMVTVRSQTEVAVEAPTVILRSETKVTIEAPIIALGEAAQPGTGALAIASAVHEYLTQLAASLVPTPMDGGAALKAGLVAFLASNPFASFATTKATAEGG